MARPFLNPAEKFACVCLTVVSCCYLLNSFLKSFGSLWNLPLQQPRVSLFVYLCIGVPPVRLILARGNTGAAYGNSLSGKGMPPAFCPLAFVCKISLWQLSAGEMYISRTFPVAVFWYVTLSNIIVQFWFSASRGLAAGEALLFNSSNVKNITRLPDFWEPFF